MIGELVGARQAIHLGGMSDPFPPAERRIGATLAVLSELERDDYPVVVSTKSTLVADEPYISTLSRPNALVQMSFSVTNDELSRAIDRGAAPTSERVRALATLATRGVKTAARLQPILPGYESDALEFVQRLAEAGVRHVGFEFLKLPLEQWPGIERLSAVVGYDLRGRFSKAGARRVGREWVLPVDERLSFALRARDEAHRVGVSFGAADTDLLPLSDSIACCSGADRLLPNAVTFEYNYLGAVRRADDHGRLTLSSLNEVWRPVRSVSSMINSRSRLAASSGVGQPVSSYIALNWNGRNNGCAPDMFFGVAATTEREADGSVIYKLSRELRTLMGLNAGESVSL